MTDLLDEDEIEVEYGDVNFFPDAILTMERSFAEEVLSRIRKFKWHEHYINSYDSSRKYSIQFALGLQLEFRVSIGTNILIIIRGTNILPGGQVSLLDPRLMESVINILARCHNRILSSTLVPQRDLLKWKESTQKWKRDLFTYEIPEEFLFQVPKNEVDCILREQTTRVIYQDRITKAIVEVEGKNEDDSLIEQRARAKLYTIRELRPL